MSLTTNDLQQIRNIVESAISSQTKEFIIPLQNEVEALRNDIKEIYDIIAELKKSIEPAKHLKKLTVEEKILQIHAELVEAAKQAGVVLPSH